MVPLSTLVAARDVQGPEFTTRFNLYRAAEITGRPAPGYSSGEAMAALEEVAAEVLPSRWATPGTRCPTRRSSRGRRGAVFAFAVLFVFLILAAQYESWSLPVQRAARTRRSRCSARSSA